MVSSMYSTSTRQLPQGQQKRISRATAPETPRQRRARLYTQAAQNGCRVRKVAAARYTVPSQRTTTAGLPVAVYTIHQLVDGGLSCDCEWGERRGPYTEENPLGCCAHTAKVALYLERAARAARRRTWLTRVAAALDQADPPAPDDEQPHCAHCGQPLAWLVCLHQWNCDPCWHAEQAVQA